MRARFDGLTSSAAYQCVKENEVKVNTVSGNNTIDETSHSAERQSISDPI
jgi:hypothetical protein